MAIINPLSTINAEIAITSNNGPIKIGNDAVQKAITIGNLTGSTSLVLNSGTGGFDLTSTGHVRLDAAGALELNSSGGVIQVGHDAVNQNINIGTAGSRTVTIGNNSGSTNVSLVAADTISSTSGALNLTSTAAMAMTAGTGLDIDVTVANLSLNAAAGLINIGNDSVDQNINIGTAGARTINVGSSSASVINLATASGQVRLSNTTAYKVVGTDASNNLVEIAPGSAGQVLMSNGTGALPTFQAAASFTYITWQSVSSGPVSVAVKNGYIVRGGSSIAFTLPSTAAVGDIIAIQGAGNSWSLAQNAGQNISFPGGASTTGVSGSVSSTTNYDSIYLICVATNNEWVYTGGFGNYSVI